MAQVMISGADGYIGQHLVKLLAADGHEVRGFSRRSRPDGFSGVEWQQGDVRHAEDVQRAVQGSSIVVHLAALPLEPSGENLENDFQVNAAGTLNLLFAALAEGVGRVIYASTAQVYGHSRRLPMAEGDRSLPCSAYAASKLCGEVLCTTFARSYGMDVVVLRLFNVYGPAFDGGERPTVEAVFVRRALGGLPVVIKSDPLEGRDYIYIDDVVRAIRMAMDKGGPGQVINLGTGVMTTLSRLAEMVIDLTGSESLIRTEKAQQEPMRMQADVRRAKNVLGFEAQMDLREGLLQLIEARRVRRKGVSV